MKKFLAMVLVLSMTLSVSAFAFYDVYDENLEVSIAALSSMNVVNGYSDGTFLPDNNLTRAEFAKLIVLLAGKESSLASASYKSEFSDVTNTHWAVSYVNLAYSLGYVEGDGNGLYSPDRNVTVAEAISVIIRMLGYETGDIGYQWPEDYMIFAYDIGLLDGIDKDYDEYITREEAVNMFNKLLNLDTKTGQSYISTISATSVSDAVIVSYNSDDMIVGVLSGSSVSYYTTVYDIPDELVMSSRGTLLINSSGKVSGFVPNDETRVTVDVGSVSSSSIVSSSGLTYLVSSSASIVIGTSKYSYASSYYELDNVSNAVLCYGDSGTVELIIENYGQTLDGYVLTGYYEDAYPSASNPSTVTIMGTTFDVSSSLTGSFASLAIGDRIIVGLDEYGDICSVSSYTYAASETMVGILGNNSVTLSCGVTVTGDVTTSGIVAQGMLVTVRATDIGEMTVSAATTSHSLTLNVDSKTLGSYSISEYCTIYECVGTSSLINSSLSALNVSTLSSSYIKYYHLNDDGEVDILLLDDVTGDVYTYGEASTNSDGQIGVTNSSGTTSRGTQQISTGIYGTYTGWDGIEVGVAFADDGSVGGVIRLTSLGEVGVSSFEGVSYVVVDGVRYEISSTVEVYNTITGVWTTLETAKSFCSTFEVFYDADTINGGEIRLIYGY